MVLFGGLCSFRSELNETQGEDAFEDDIRKTEDDHQILGRMVWNAGNGWNDSAARAASTCSPVSTNVAMIRRKVPGFM